MAGTAGLHFYRCRHHRTYDGVWKQPTGMETPIRPWTTLRAIFVGRAECGGVAEPGGTELIGRLFILLVAVVGVGLYFPGSRAFMVDWSQPVLEPGERWMTRQELRQIATDLDQFTEGRGAAPLRRGEFDSWLDRRYPQASSRVDSWDTRYSAEVSRSEVLVISAGPDRRFGTADDLEWERSRD